MVLTEWVCVRPRNSFLTNDPENYGNSVRPEFGKVKGQRVFLALWAKRAASLLLEQKQAEAIRK